MNAKLSYTNNKSDISITIPGSKSESNRLLILQALYPNIEIENCSNSDDTLNLIKGLDQIKGIVDVGHAGTAMRFLTAYYASKKGTDIIITGSDRMKERPIQILVDVLLDLGADIQYLNKVGFPPLKIHGKELKHASISLNSNISSQYVTALLLIAPGLSNGLKLNLEGGITSKPYIEMTLNLLNEIGVSSIFSNHKIEIFSSKKVNDKIIEVESDWSSASYFYSIVALSNNMTITLKNFKSNSFQGDSVLPTLFEPLGVKTYFNTAENSITLKRAELQVNKIDIDLNNTPDVAQTIAVTCFGLGLPCILRGLKTLKIKETDRLLALKTELEKLGAKVILSKESIEVLPLEGIKPNILIETYEDHRMAMAFAPLALLTPIEIVNLNVVSKSYPTFWKDLEKVGIEINIK